MIKIYYPPAVHRENREYLLIKQGLVNNARVEIVTSEKESDFVFLFYYVERQSRPSPNFSFPPEKTVIIDYHDNPHWFLNSNRNMAYFKRSWTEMEKKKNYTTRKPCQKPFKVHPITFAIMDEFIIDEDQERDISLSCTFRPVKHRGHLNRERVLTLLRESDIPGNVQLGSYTRGSMKRFNDSEMREYFRLLKRSRIVVTCNPGRWDGDHRTWEALANGALVFVDKMYVPLAHPLVDGKHCIFYEPSDYGLMEMKGKILYFMENQDKAEAIAKEGYEFAMKYHRTSNRIDEILEVITRQ